MILAKSHCTQSIILPCSSLMSSCWTTMKRIPLEGWYQYNMLQALSGSGVEGRRSRCNLPLQCCLFSCSSGYQMFLYNVSCIHHCDQIPNLEELWNLFAYEKSKSSRLRPLLYLGAKERQSFLVDISSVLSSDLVQFF